MAIKLHAKLGGTDLGAITDYAIDRLRRGLHLAPRRRDRPTGSGGQVRDTRWRTGVDFRKVTPYGFNLNTGTTYLPEVEGYQRRPSAGSDAHGGRMRLDEGYTLDSMEQVLERVEAPPGVSDLSGFAVFAGYLVLDALVGNGDRHPGNWAILERQSDGARFLAPTYDHGSALGAGLTADNRRD